jgi:hypothetical protein
MEMHTYKVQVRDAIRAETTAELRQKILDWAIDKVPDPEGSYQIADGYHVMGYIDGDGQASKRFMLVTTDAEVNVSVPVSEAQWDGPDVKDKN